MHRILCRKVLRGHQGRTSSLVLASCWPQPNENTTRNQMVSFTRLATSYLAFAAPSSSRPLRKSPDRNRGVNRSVSKKSRRSTDTIGSQEQRGNRNKFRSKGRNDAPSRKRNDILAPPPPLTISEGPFPTYFSCRHTYEGVLMEEINRTIRNDQEAKVSSPSSGLVRVIAESDDLAAHIESLDPIYALQSIPQCAVIEAKSIKPLAIQALKALQIDEDSPATEQSQELRKAPRGSLAVHYLVPGMFRGQRDPVLVRRAEKVAQEAVKILKKGYSCARRRQAAMVDENGEQQDAARSNTPTRWILQLLLFSPEVMAASLTKCRTIPNLPDATWPNSCHPAGLANVDIVEAMPSSAYRKLLEAFECMQMLPPRSNHPRDEVPPVIDLGACPGGWTAALRRLGARVISVDRSELKDDLMQDDMVTFIKGDAFTYEPPWADDSRLATRAPEGTWMVSDVIAYPERVKELLDRWCGGKWAGNMIVTAKFQGDTIPWKSLNAAVESATKHGYECRVKHFFNNKNEVTLMVSQPLKDKDCMIEKNEFFPGKPMYSPALASD